ncbi:AAA family ATPase [Vibrio vulnificus]|nr:AAA family ATPase [Vibrio vulnificus]
MSLALPNILELDSQTELLERLELLTNFGSNLITINGAKGFGKSWLAQRYLEQYAQEKNQCLVLCHPSQDDSQHRTLILSQLVNEPLFNPNDALIESAEHLFSNQVCDFAIVIDDAQLLSEKLVSELWVWVLEAQTNPQWTVNVLLFSESDALESLLTRLGYGQEHKPVDLDIDRLSEAEAMRFFESMVVRYVDDANEKKVRTAFKKVDPVPGAIMALGDLKVEKRIIIRSIVASPLNIVLTILLLLLLAAAGYWWMFSQPSADDKAAEMSRTLEQTAIPTLELVTESEVSTKAVVDQAEKHRQQNAAQLLQDAQDDTNALPPAVAEQTVSVGISDHDQQRVTIESDVVDALLADKPNQVNTDNIDALVAENTTKTPVVAPEPLLAENNALVPAVVSFSFAREELKALSPRGYTLQLAAMTSLQDVQAFLDKHQLQNQVRIYPTLRNETEWYIITYQDYPTIQMARDAVAGLPKPLQSLGPWAKSLSQVHREIDRVK